ncbi:MAG: pyridoxamine 5'-phosphate oxidase family protein [Dehalococcoidia bacterium]
MLGTDKLDAFISRSFTGIVAVVRTDGSPATSMVTYARLGDEIYFSTTLDRLKGRRMAADPRIALCVVNDLEPNSYASIEGLVIIHRDNPKHLHERMFTVWQAFAERHPQSVWPQWGRAGLEKVWSQPERAIFELRPTRVSGIVG